MATIRIQRTSEFINNMRRYDIYIDGKKEARISNGSTIELEVNPGTHVLYAKIDWGLSEKIEFDITEGDVRVFKVGGFKKAKYIMPAGLVFILLYMIFGYEIYIFLILSLSVLMILIYYLTFGRKRYLTLEEV